MVQNNTRHQLVLVLSAACISLARSFVPNKVPSSPLSSLVCPQKKWRSASNDCLVRFTSSSPVDSSLQQEQHMGATTTPAQVTFTDSPEVVFQQLAVGSFVGVEELKQWEELQDLLVDDDITQTELEDMLAEIITKKDTTNENDKLDQAGFVLLYDRIDNLFEYDEDTDTEGDINAVGGNDSAAVEELTKEEELLSFLTDSIQNGVTDDKLPCGMDCTDTERETITNMVSDLEGASQNLVLTKNGKIETKDLLGDWDLLYTGSKAMISNKSLSGLAGSPSQKVEFSGVRQRLTGSKFLGFVEYLETFNAGTEESFDVKITGEWMLKKSPNRNPLTGQPATAIQVDPENIEYGRGYGMAEQAPVVQMGGGLSQCASWQSLGPIKLLDIIYLTTDLQIARGNSNTDAIFVWKKKKN